MRNNRTTVRSLVTTQGTFLAMSDGMVVWEATATRRTLHLRTAATALLGVKEDNKIAFQTLCRRSIGTTACHSTPRICFGIYIDGQRCCNSSDVHR